MIKIDRKVFENLIDKIVSSTDIRKILNEFSGDYVFFSSFLKDIAKGEYSPNYDLLKKLARERKVSAQFIIEQAKIILKYLTKNEPKEDYYAILHVLPSSSSEEIRKSWLNLIKLQHPDKVGESGLEITKKINEAYGVLGNPKNRIEYDANYHPELPIKVTTFWTMELSKTPVFVVLLAFIVFAAGIYFTESGPFFRSKKETRVIAKGGSQPQSPASNFNSPPLIRETKTSKVIKRKKAGREVPSQPVKSSVESIIAKKESSNDLSKEKEQNVDIKSEGTSQLTKLIEKPSSTETEQNKVVALLNKEIKNAPKANENLEKKDINRKEENNLQSNRINRGDEFIVSQTNQREIAKRDVLEEQVEKKSFQESAREVVVKKEKEKTKEVARKSDNILESEEKPGPTIKDSSSTKSERPEMKVALSLPEESEKVLFASENKKEEIPTKEGTNVLKPKGKSKLKENEYVVKDGDNLWLIARRFDTRVKDLKELNNLNNNRLDIGDVLLIPPNLEQESHVKKLVKGKTNERKQSLPNKGHTSSISNKKLAKKQEISGTPKPKARAEREFKVQEVKVPNEEAQTEPLAPSSDLSQIKGVNPNKLSPRMAYPDKESLLSFVSSYVSAYKSRDITSFKSFFKQNAKENGIEISKILPFYRKNFSSLEIIKYDFNVKKADMKDQKAFVDGDFEVLFKKNNDRNIKSSRGSLNWSLAWESNGWKIEEITYRIKKGKSEVENL